jgi:DNA-binding NtrC family response regulator
MIDDRPFLLFLEDHEVIRAILTGRLRAGGVDVLDCPTVESALFAMGDPEIGSHVDVILADLSLSDGDSPHFLSGAKLSFPGVRIVIYSGLTSSDIEESLLRFPAAEFLKKPSPFADIWLACFPGRPL